jgi:hypothetical protein
MAIGDHLRDVMDLYGSPACPHTNAVMIAAGEKGVDVNCHAEQTGVHLDLFAVCHHWVLVRF